MAHEHHTPKILGRPVWLVKWIPTNTCFVHLIRVCINAVQAVIEQFETARQRLGDQQIVMIQKTDKLAGGRSQALIRGAADALIPLKTLYLDLSGLLQRGEQRLKLSGRGAVIHDAPLPIATCLLED